MLSEENTTLRSDEPKEIIFLRPLRIKKFMSIKFKGVKRKKNTLNRSGGNTVRRNSTWSDSSDSSVVEMMTLIEV